MATKKLSWLVAISSFLVAAVVFGQDVIDPKPNDVLINDLPKGKETAAKQDSKTEKDTKQDDKGDKSAKPAAEADRKNPADPKATLTRLIADQDVWIDGKNKQVVIEGQVCLTRGMLEMFAVPKGTKEHEAVVSVNCKAAPVHAALLAVGAVPGSTVKYRPSFIPAKGPKVEVLVYWTDEKGKQQKARAQEWVRDTKTKKAMEYPWVFGGSGFFTDPQTGNEYYQAESGDLICVSNFGDAMLDLPIESTDSNDDLEFEAFTEHIPPKGTKVTVVLAPEVEKKAESSGKAVDKSGSKGEGEKKSKSKSK
jgi:hypothetical protein